MDDTGFTMTQTLLRDDGLLYETDEVGSQNIVSYFWERIVNNYENYFRAIGETIRQLDEIGIR